MSGVRIINPTWEKRESVEFIRGPLDTSTIHLIKVDLYQRGSRDDAHRKRLMEAFKRGDPVPDVELGLRGNNIIAIGAPDDTVPQIIETKDDLYNMDGLQRVSALIQCMKENPKFKADLSCRIQLHTTRETEEQLFLIFNKGRKQVPNNIHLRNLHTSVKCIGLLKRLSEDDPSFALHRRICWIDKLRDHEFSLAQPIVKALRCLHSRHVSSSVDSIIALADSLNELENKIGMELFEANTRYFFNVVDKCWEVRSIVLSGTPYCMKYEFLKSLGNLFGRHTNFWEGCRLIVPDVYIEALKKFPFSDKNVKDDISERGKKACNKVYHRLVNFLDSKRRVNKLIKFDLSQHYD